MRSSSVPPLLLPSLVLIFSALVGGGGGAAVPAASSSPGAVRFLADNITINATENLSQEIHDLQEQLRQLNSSQGNVTNLSNFNLGQSSQQIATLKDQVWYLTIAAVVTPMVVACFLLALLVHMRDKLQRLREIKVGSQNPAALRLALAHIRREHPDWLDDLGALRGPP